MRAVRSQENMAVVLSALEEKARVLVIEIVAVAAFTSWLAPI